MALEEEFGLSENIPEEELAEVTTVGQAFDIVVSKL
jgi:acyl carrier protein